MASGINMYSFFSDIRNNYSRYLKNYFGYHKTGTYFRYPKELFWISKTTISDIQNNYF